MPTFDFQCAKCDHIFEFNRQFGSKANPACPACKSKKTEKLLSVPAIAFKGSGWYKTDSMSGGAKKAAKKEETKESATTGTEGTLRSDSGQAPETKGATKETKATEGKKESKGAA
jgi:putative FmdB family regulatory protein